ncbi:MAG: DUF3467 domain-containing protein [Patescibacteria group bacterium]|nr:DUF3467 domain-containing protein [Patescibacteria group bacterium]
MEKGQPEIQISAEPHIARGEYANVLMINHSKEEFIFDFMNIIGQRGHLVSRIFTSPGHMKRISKALQENIKLYEDKFGEIEEAEGPKQSIGFKI